MLSVLVVLPRSEVSGGGKDAFEGLFFDFYGPVMGFFGKRGCPAEDCKDLAQETFLRAYRSFEGFRGESQPLTWLLTIATNVWRNRFRDAMAAKRSGDEVPLREDDRDPAWDEHPQAQAIGSERRRLLKAAIDNLPRKMQQCVLLRVYQDMPYRDIAKLLGGTETTAKSQFSRARSRLRSGLAGHYPELDAEPDDGGT